MKNLIEKYFQGETSLEEEAKLKAYFNSNEVDESLLQYQPLFQLFTEENKMELGDEFDEKFFDSLDANTKVVPMRSWSRKLMKIAAAAAVVFAAYLFFDKPAPPSQPVIDWTAYEIDDEQMAYEETVKALRLLSTKLNKGKSKTVKEVSKTESVTKYLN